MEDNKHSESRIESWKEIAAYLKRDVRTVVRWEKSEGLPVHRQMHQARGNVFAYASELEAWKARRNLHPAAPPRMSFSRRVASAAAFGLSMLLALVTLGSGPIFNPAIASAQGIVNREVWANGDTFGKLTSDGSFLTFTDWETGDLAVRDLVTGQSRHVTDTGGWDKLNGWAERSFPSHDGKQIAYCWFTDTFELRVINSDGTGARTLVHDMSLAYVQPVGWSQDGSQIFADLISKDFIPRIVSVSVKDGAVRTLATLHPAPRDWRDMPRVAVSPNGEYMAFDDSQADNPSHHDIFYLSADGSTRSPLVVNPAEDYPLAWTPDGKTLLFSSDRGGEPSFWALEVTNGAPQGSPRLVRPNTGDVSPLGISPNGSFYYGIRNGIVDMYTASYDFETGERLKPPTEVTQSFMGRNASPDWSPDGSQLAFLSGRGTRADPSVGAVLANTIVIRSLRTGEERELRPELAVMGQNYMGLIWSSDGSALLVRGTDEQGHDGIFRVDAHTGKVTTLLAGKVLGGVFRLASTKDNQVLAFTRNDPTEKFNTVCLRNLQTGVERAIVGGPDYAFINAFAFSPDGSLLVFAARGVLRVMSTRGGEQRELLKIRPPDYPRWVGWTPDGRNILFATTDQKMKCKIGTVSAAGGDPHYVDLGMSFVKGIRLSPDGHGVAFVAGSTSLEVWVLQNFLPTLQASN